MRNAEEPGQPPRPSSAPPGSGAENQRPCPDRSTPDDSGAGSSSVPEVLHPVIQNEEVDELERDILDDDLAVQGDPREREIDLRAPRDRGALDECELYAEVIAAVEASEGPLTKDELDEILGLRGKSHVANQAAAS
jgi:hypothetical protein